MNRQILIVEAPRTVAGGARPHLGAAPGGVAD